MGVVAETWTLEDVATLKAAIAKGVRSVKYQDKEITYNSVDDMMTALRRIEKALGINQKKTRLFAEASKGIK